MADGGSKAGGASPHRGVVGAAGGRPRSGRFPAASTRSFNVTPTTTVKTFAVQQHAAGTKGVRKGELILELESGVLVIQRSGKLRRTSVEHIRHFVVRPADARAPQSSTAGSCTLELQFDYNGVDSSQGRSIKVFDFDHHSSRENFQRLVLALLFCREALAPVFDIYNGDVEDGSGGGGGSGIAGGDGAGGDPCVSVGAIFRRVFHKKEAGAFSAFDGVGDEASR
jgi:hypothetical protein